jgi:hypothetical protein
LLEPTTPLLLEVEVLALQLKAQKAVMALIPYLAPLLQQGVAVAVDQQAGLPQTQRVARAALAAVTLTKEAAQAVLVTRQAHRHHKETMVVRD